MSSLCNTCETDVNGVENQNQLNQFGAPTTELTRNQINDIKHDRKFGSNYTS